MSRPVARHYRNPSLAIDKRGASGRYFVFQWGKNTVYYLELKDTHFGRVFCTTDELLLPSEVPKGLTPAPDWQVPEEVKNKLAETAHDAQKEWL